MIQDAEWVCAVAENLREGDEALINDRSRALTVTGRDEEDGAGTDYPYYRVKLKGNGTEYVLRYSHLLDQRPTLYIGPTWKVVERGAETERIMTNVTSKRGVNSIETTTGGETAIVSEQSAEKFIEATVPEQSALSDVEVSETEIEGDRLGDCPECDGEVVKDDKRAICTDCDLWCWMAQWEAYETA